jgi:hypothetical protein
MSDIVIKAENLGKKYAIGHLYLTQHSVLSTCFSKRGEPLARVRRYPLIVA